MDDKNTVREAYNAIAETYLQWVIKRPTLHEEKLEVVLAQLNKTSRVLDLGCGAGKPITKRLCEEVGHVIGVDISEKQIELATQNAPKAELILGDMASVDFEPASFDAVFSFYALFHVPRDEHEGILRKIYSWLKPSGLLLVTFPALALEASKASFHGAPNFFSSWKPNQSQLLAENAGFEIISAEIRAQ